MLTSAALIATGTLAVPAVAVAPPHPSHVAARCVVKPLLPKVIVLSHKVERRTFVLKTSCRLTAPLTLKSYADAKTVADTFTWRGNGHGVLGNGAKYVWARNVAAISWIGTLRVPSQPLTIARDPALPAQTTAVSYDLLLNQVSTQAGIYSMDQGDTFSGNIETFTGSTYTEGFQGEQQKVLIQYKLGTSWKTLKSLSVVGTWYLALPMTRPRIYRAKVVPQVGLTGFTTKGYKCSGADRPGGGC